MPSLQQLLTRCDKKHSEIASLVQAMAALLGHARCLIDEAQGPANTRLPAAPQRLSFEVECLVSSATTIAGNAKDLGAELGELLQRVRADAAAAADASMLLPRRLFAVTDLMGRIGWLPP